mgnify:CR=1 FL=1
MWDTQITGPGSRFITLSVELDNTRPYLMEAVKKGFDGFEGLLIRILDEAKATNEISANIDTESIAETLFAGMLGASVLYGAEKDDSTLDRSINALIDYVCQLNDEHMQEQFN